MLGGGGSVGGGGWWWWWGWGWLFSRACHQKYDLILVLRRVGRGGGSNMIVVGLAASSVFRLYISRCRWELE